MKSVFKELVRKNNDKKAMQYGNYLYIGLNSNIFCGEKGENEKFSCNRLMMVV